MNQEERRTYLTKYLLDENPEYRTIRIPDGEAEQRAMLRSLMNVRMPGAVSDDFLKIQNDYLQGQIRKNGIVGLENIPTINAQGSQNPYAECISVWQGDITRLAVDVIVNAANSQMLGCFLPMHTCIDNCIHTFAGIQLRRECDRQMKELRLKYGKTYEQPTAVPMLTDAFNLPAKKVIHIVGPIVPHQLTPELEKDLADCYRNTLDLCAANDLRSVAFCCISTGVFHFPNQRAAQIAVQTVTDWLSEHPEKMQRVIFNVFKDEDKNYYEAELL